MSYDFVLCAPNLKDDLGRPHNLAGFKYNVTYNLAPMFAKALGCPVRELGGRKCSEVEPILMAGIRAMKDDPETYEAMNPANGWGSAKGALAALEAVAAWCAEVPDAELGIW